MIGSLALLDANVLYSARVRDLLLELAAAGFFEPRWTQAIQLEWTSSLLRHNKRVVPAALERTRARMENTIPDGLISGYESHIPHLSLPDPGDRHVLAAAITGECDVIVTQNLQDFPESALAPRAIMALRPDSFLSELMPWSPGSFCAVVRRVRTRLQKPPYSAAEYLANLEKVGLASTAAMLAERLGEI